MPKPRPSSTSGTTLRMTEQDYDRARRALMRRDPMLGAIIKRVGPCRMRAYGEGDLFCALVQTIVSQQLSVRVADVIYGRVSILCGDGPTPQGVLALSLDQLRAAGLSMPKARYVHDLAARCAAGTLTVDAIEHLPDEDVIAALSEVKGIGRWSAQMILLFRLNRPDIWPIGDLGIVRALERLHNLRKPASLKRLEKMGEEWRPYRSVAAWYLWHSGK